MRSSQHPTTSGQLASGEGATAGAATSIGFGGPQAANAAAVTSTREYDARACMLVVRATSILLNSVPRTRVRRFQGLRIAQTLLAGRYRLKPQREALVRETALPVREDPPVNHRPVLAAIAFAVGPALLPAQPSYLDLTVNDVGVAIGDAPRVTGLRINFRDRYLERVNGVNITVWTPYVATGDVRGIAIGVPATGARNIDGLALGLGGVGAEERLRGIAIAPIGAGAGQEITGLLIAGIGGGSGGRITGVAITGLGVGSGGGVRGLMIGGLGVGTGGRLTGITIAGLGAGAGEGVDGLMIAGLGVGSGGRVRGISIAGLGVGSGEGVTGLSIAGLGIGSGGEIRGLSISGAGVGAPRIRGIVITGIGAGTLDFNGGVIAPFYFRIEREGSMRGVSVSAFNRLSGVQHGVTIGVLNIAEHLRGVQIGLINIARNNPSGRRVLPIVNWGGPD